MRIPTPRLPIAIPANATLTLTRELGSYIIDDRTGNEIPEIESIEVRASLTKDLYQNRLAEGVGSDLQSIYLIGYILDPPDDISDFELDGIATMTLADFATGNTLLGEFEFHYVPTPFGATLTTIGIPIRGIYRVVENVEVVGAKRLTGTIASTATYSASLTLTLFLSGASEAAAVLTGQLTEIQYLLGAIASTATYTGDLSIGNQETISGTIEAIGSYTGVAHIEKRLSGTIESNGTFTSDVSITKTLIGSVNATANNTGNIAITKTLAGAIVSTGETSGSISLEKLLTGAIVATGTYEANLTAGATLKGTIASTGSIAGNTSVFKLLQGTIISTSLYEATLTTEKRLSGVIDSDGSYEGDLTAGSTLKGTISATGSYAGSASITKLVSGTITATGDTSATLSTEKQLAGIIGATATNNGTLSTVKQLAGTIDSTGTIAASLSNTKVLAGAIESVGALDADVTIIKSLSGTLDAVGDYEGDLSIVGEAALSGTIEATGNYAGNVSTERRLSGTIAAIGATTAFLGNSQTASVVIDGGSATSSGDQFIYDYLRSRGFTTAFRSDSGAPITGRDLIVISQSASGALVADDYKNSTSPVICLEPAIFDDMGMTGTVNNVDYGFATTQTQINITNNTHPLSAGLSTGATTVYNSSGNIVWGVPNGNAVTIAALASDSGKYTIFAYGSGVAMVSGTSTNKRIGFFIGSANNEATLLNSNGLALFNAAIKWATTPVYLTGTIAASGTYSGDLGRIKLFGTIAASGDYTGSASLEKSLIGAVNTTGTYTGNLTVEGGTTEPSLDFSDANNSMYIPLL